MVKLYNKKDHLYCDNKSLKLCIVKKETSTDRSAGSADVSLVRITGVEASDVKISTPQKRLILRVSNSILLHFIELSSSLEVEYWIVNMKDRRAVVTGMGVVSPLGNSVPAFSS